MDGKAGAEQSAFIESQNCDVLLLTEVKLGWSPAGYEMSPGVLMTEGKLWAAIASHAPQIKLAPPHPASAAATIEGTTYVSSILPWRSSGGEEPWHGDTHASRTKDALKTLAQALGTYDRLVWGGDWNHALSGDEWAGSSGGRQALLAVLAELGLEVPTADLPHRIPGLLTIDHIAVRANDSEATRVDAAGLSDHDFYVVDKRDERSPR